MKRFLAIVFTLAFVAWMVTRVVMAINFDRHCEGYLKRAADANTVELAAQNLAIAIDYAERRGLTEGYTSILYRTPDEDVGFWYENLTSALSELRAVDPEATQLEKTNILMKLRETLMDEGESTSVTTPPGIAVFPANTAFALWVALSGLLAAGFILWWIIEEDPFI